MRSRPKVARWARRHLASLVALVLVCVAAAYLAGTRNSALLDQFAESDPVDVAAGETTRIKGHAVRLTHVRTAGSLPTYAGEPAEHPRGTKFVVVELVVTPTRQAGKLTLAETRLCDGAGRCWDEGSLEDLSDAEVETAGFGDGKGTRPYVVRTGFVVDDGARDFTVEVAGLGLNPRYWRFAT
ncbi:MAG: hypothetical protein GEV10_05770 [Streptosporangiales bacterium]|nr:hypothetical protein [Streptosporangiales bacterium]